MSVRVLLLIASIGIVPLLNDSGKGDDDFLFYGDAVDDAIEVIAEQSQSGTSSTDGPWGEYISDRSSSFTAAPTDVAVIRDSADSFCVSDLQLELCIPDAGEGEGGDEESGEPTVVDVVGEAAAQIERDIARLGVAPARIQHQPPGGEVLVNMDTIFYTEAAAQYLSTTVLGRSVTIEVTPAWFEWDFGDGSEPFGTADRGAPYPNHTVSHVYSFGGENFITLRATWNARFRVEGVSNWIAVSGQPVTTDEIGPIRAVTKTNKLVLLD